MCFRVAQIKMQCNPEFSLCKVLITISIVMLFLGHIFNSFKIPTVGCTLSWHTQKCSVQEPSVACIEAVNTVCLPTVALIKHRPTS